MDSDLHRKEVLRFTALLRTFGSRDAYKKLVDAAQAYYRPMTSQDWEKIRVATDPDLRLGSPGHAYGHTHRDGLVINALITDKKVQVYQPAEITASQLAKFHDYATSFIDRQRDTEYLAGHAEDGSYRCYQKFHGLIEENLLLLTCLAIASHTHYLKPVVCKDKSVREPWWFELYEVDGQKYGWAIVSCRFTDRVDTNGGTLLLRFFFSNSFAAGLGDAQDFSAESFFSINAQSLLVMVKPIVANLPTSEGKKAPTGFQHVADFYNSNFGNTAYSEFDHLFPTFSRLLSFKAAQFLTMKAMIRKPSAWAVLKVKLGLDNPIEAMRVLMYRIDRSSHCDEAWAVFHKAFSSLSAEELATWSPIITYLSESYDQWLQILKFTITENSNEFTDYIVPLLDELIAEVS